MMLEEKIKDYIIQKSPVNIYYNNETGKWLYSVQVKGTDFWLDSFETNVKAIEFCNNNGLPLD